MVSMIQARLVKRRKISKLDRSFDISISLNHTLKSIKSIFQQSLADWKKECAVPFLTVIGFMNE